MENFYNWKNIEKSVSQGSVSGSGGNDYYFVHSASFSQIGTTGTFHHFIRRKVTIKKIGLDNIKDVAGHANSLPLMRDRVLGIDFKNKLKERTK